MHAQRDAYTSTETSVGFANHASIARTMIPGFRFPDQQGHDSMTR
jgi:hypothetical protein